MASYTSYGYDIQLLPVASKEEELAYQQFYEQASFSQLLQLVKTEELYQREVLRLEKESLESLAYCLCYLVLVFCFMAYLYAVYTGVKKKELAVEAVLGKSVWKRIFPLLLIEFFAFVLAGGIICMNLQDSFYGVIRIRTAREIISEMALIYLITAAIQYFVFCRFDKQSAIPVLKGDDD